MFPYIMNIEGNANMWASGKYVNIYTSNNNRGHCGDHILDL